jgi:hypothetical protein
MPSDYKLTRRRPSAYFHGGVAGLPAGACIPPAGLVEADDDDTWYRPGDPDFCFVTTDLLQAWYSALNCEDERGASAVYRVEPIGRLWLDLDGSGINFACRQARILTAGVVPGWVRAAWKADQKGFVDDIRLWWDTFKRSPGEKVIRQRIEPLSFHDIVRL